MFYTPLRYPGGKGKLSYYIKSIIDVNSINDGVYIEPYAGGAAVALELLMQEYVRYIHINDIDPAIYNFWFSVINHTDELCKLINDVDVNIEMWEEQKKIIADPQNNTQLAIGFSAFFLNRTNRSGILKAGVIGGKRQDGNWKMDVRFNKKDLINRIEKIADYGSRISLYNSDTLEFLNGLSHVNTTNSLLYLDPPYYLKGQGLYRNFYNHDDHVLVMKALKDTHFKNWIVSYDNAVEIKEIYQDFRIQEYSLQYTAQLKKVGGEVMIFSPEIKIPPLSIGVKQ
ncbi:TPA: DNA adenine methylase [Serratia fonticola]